MFFSAIATAADICWTLPPCRYTSAAAAMADAVPISAWQPASAPDIEARDAITMPKPAAIYSAAISSSRGVS